jgi:hypothetical protein
MSGGAVFPDLTNYPTRAEVPNFINGGAFQTVSDLLANFAPSSQYRGMYARVSDLWGSVSTAMICEYDGTNYYWRPQRTDYSVTSTQNIGRHEPRSSRHGSSHHPAIDVARRHDDHTIYDERLARLHVQNLFAGISRPVLHHLHRADRRPYIHASRWIHEGSHLYGIRLAFELNKAWHRIERASG